jgi:hypothetical protein
LPAAPRQRRLAAMQVLREAGREDARQVVFMLPASSD